MVFHWSLSDSMSQDFMTLLSILANLNNAVVLMVSTCPLISKSSSLFTNPLGIVPSAPITISITITFMFHSFILVLQQGLDINLSFCFLLILLCGLLRGQYPLFSRFSFFCWLSLGLVIGLRLGDLFISQNPRELCASHSPGWILGCA